MKKILNLIYVFITALLFSSCVDFKDEPGKNVWSEGLWLVPSLTSALTLYFLYKFLKAYEKYKEYPGKNKKLNYGWLFLAAGAFVATLVIVYVVIAER